MDKNNTLRKLQLCEIEILDEFVRLCNKNNLRYYLAGGTLLGAVRHGGFIPWDDDIDVEMPRDDYNRFAECCSRELDSSFFYQSSLTDSHYFLTYAKLRKNNTLFYEKRFEKSEFHKGVFIDIFPLDYAPKNRCVRRFLYNIMAIGNRRGQVDSGEVVAPYSKLSGKICWTLLKPVQSKGMLKLRYFTSLLSKRLSSRKYFASYSGAYGYSREIFPSEWYSTSAMIRFEEKEYSAPSKYKYVLNTLYGEDYMVVPPEHERRYHCDLNRIIL